VQHPPPSSPKRLGFFTVLAVSALTLGAFGACGDTETESDDDSSSSTTTTTGGGGSQPTACSGSDLSTCLSRCDTLNDLNCGDAALQQSCRDKCNASTETACVDYAACDNADCDARLDCWNVFSGSGTGPATCGTACANVVVECSDTGGIDIATCNSLCANYSQTQIDCAEAASDCQAVQDCVGGFPM
jgi:hypothetical protein